MHAPRDSDYSSPDNNKLSLGNECENGLCSICEMQKICLCPKFHMRALVDTLNSPFIQDPYMCISQMHGCNLTNEEFRRNLINKVKIIWNCKRLTF